MDSVFRSVVNNNSFLFFSDEFISTKFCEVDNSNLIWGARAIDAFIICSLLDDDLVAQGQNIKAVWESICLIQKLCVSKVHICYTWELYEIRISYRIFLTEDVASN